MVTAVPLQVIGIDPGPIPGLVLLRPGSSVHVVQCTHITAPAVFKALLQYDEGCPTIVQVERFVVGRGSMKTGRDGELTRDLIGALQEVWSQHDSTATGRLGGRWFQRSAAAVKPWATDMRLAHMGLLEPTKGMRHARDAARHALFAAVHDGGIPDPLSKGARR